MAITVLVTAITVTTAAITVLVAAITVTTTVVDKDNVGITTLLGVAIPLDVVLGVAIPLDVVVVATPLPVVETPPVRNEGVTPSTTKIFVRAEPSNFAVPLPIFGRSC